MMLISLLLIPLAAAGLIALARRRASDGTVARSGGNRRRWPRERRSSPRCGTVAVLTAVDDLFRVDALSALMVAIITFLGAIAALYAVGYIRAEFDDAHLPRARLFFRALPAVCFHDAGRGDDGQSRRDVGRHRRNDPGDGLSGQFAPDSHVARSRLQVFDFVFRGHRAGVHRHRADVLRRRRKGR